MRGSEIRGHSGFWGGVIACFILAGVLLIAPLIAGAYDYCPAEGCPTGSSCQPFFSDTFCVTAGLCELKSDGDSCGDAGGCCKTFTAGNIFCTMAIYTCEAAPASCTEIMTEHVQWANDMRDTGLDMAATAICNSLEESINGADCEGLCEALMQLAENNAASGVDEVIDFCASACQ